MNNYKYKILLLFLFAIIFVNGYLVYQRKGGLFCDEVYSFLVANNQRTDSLEEYLRLIKEQGGQENFWDFISDQIKNGDREEFLGNEYVKYCSIVDNKRFDLINVYCNKLIADEHPPLYYSVLHVVSCIYHSTQLYLIGFSINIVFILLTCLLLYKIFLVVDTDHYSALVMVAFFGLSFGYVDNVTVCRMYVMSAFECTLLLFLYIKYLSADRLSGVLQFFICIVEICAMLTHYFTLFYISPLFYITFKYLRKDKIKSHRFMVANVCALLLFIILWPQSIACVMTRTGTRLQMGCNLVHRMYYYCCHVLCAIFNDRIIGVILLSIFFLLLIYYEYKHKGELKKLLLNATSTLSCKMLVYPIVTYFLITVVVSPFVQDRYIFPIIPISTLVFFLFVKKLLNLYRVKNAYICAFTIFFLICSNIFVIPTKQIKFLNENTPSKSDFKAKYEKCNALFLPIVKLGLNLEPLVNNPHKSYSMCDVCNGGLNALKEDTYIFYKIKRDPMDGCLYDNIDSCFLESPFNAKQIDGITDNYITYLLERK